MKRTITIGSEENAKDIAFEANALFPHAMREIFGINVFEKLQGIDIKNVKASDEMIELVSEMAFVMAKSAETQKARELLGLNRDAYYEWLMQFEAFDLIDAASEIMDVYMSSKKNLSEAKNPASPQ